MPKQPSIAKITRPRLPKVLFRKRLFSMLDRGRSVSVTWVSGPGGSGKTTLVASWLDARKLPCLWYHLDEGDGDIATFFYYLGLAAKKAAPHFKKPLPLLTPEYMRGIPAFTKRYFENLCTRLHPPFVIVLDNYHHVAPDSLFHDVVRDALFAIPEGIAVIIMSRSMPPPTLALLQTYNNIHSIGWNELKFDLRETRALLGPGQGKSRAQGLPGQLHRITEGWAAGLVLLKERLRTRDSAPRDIDRFKSGELFGYFASEIFEKMPPDLQTFLLKTAFLPSISPHAALTLTNRKDTEEILASLSRNHFFTERRSVSNPVYQYHPLFREFLQARARETYSRDEQLDAMRCAARLFEDAGQVEDAAELYRMSEEWKGLVKLIRAHAGSMASQGRSKPLEEWLKSLPEKILDHDPWLLYWMGVCRMPFDLPEGRSYFERSLALFRKQRDTSGIYLAWCGAVETLVQEMGDTGRLKSWVALFEVLVKEFGYPPPDIEVQVTIRIFAALQWRRADPTFAFWNDKALALMDSNEDAGLRMVTGFYLFSYHLWWIGDYTTSRRVLDIMRRIAKTHQNLPPLVLTLLKSSEALYALVTGAHEHCLNMVSEGIGISNNHGIHIWDKSLLMAGSGSCLCAGDLAQAGELLDKIASGLEGSRLFDRFYYYHKSAWRFMLMNDLSQAMAYEKTAIELASKTGFEIAEAQAHFALVHLMRMTGERKKEKEHILRCRRIGRRMGSAIVEFMSLLSEAALAFDEKDEKAGLSYLKDAMAIGRGNGYVYFCWWHSSLMTPLCVKALEAGIEVDYVKGLIGKCNLVPEEPPVHIESWPWPIRIYTLGRFELMKDGKRVRFSGKVQKKPLEMLKALVAFGGSSVAEVQVTDALWPDADGDLAHRSFETTLYRLRKLVGNDVIQLRHGQLTLDARRCWVDAWAFERMAENAECGARDAVSARQKKQIAPLLIENAKALYQGLFLPSDAREPWTLSMRERLRNKFLRLVVALGQRWETARHYNKAADYYEQGLETDGLAEEFYQRLMLCRIRLGQQAEAARTYHRCKAMLAKTLGLAPSSKTEDIYSSLRRMRGRAAQKALYRNQ